MSDLEVWLRGRVVEGVPALLQPVAHSLLQCGEEVQRSLAGMTAEQIWHSENAAASIGFHVLHAIGSLDRLFTYARGEMLSDDQRRALTHESQPNSDVSAEDLRTAFDAAVERALDQLRTTDFTTLTDVRVVGRSKLPSTVVGLLFHAAEHAQRHAGQIVTTKKLGRFGSGPSRLQNPSHV
jgi:uncharacterized damage-inducible protein DinB